MLVPTSNRCHFFHLISFHYGN